MLITGQLGFSYGDKALVCRYEHLWSQNAVCSFNSQICCGLNERKLCFMDNIMCKYNRMIKESNDSSKTVLLWWLLCDYAAINK